LGAASARPSATKGVLVRFRWRALVVGLVAASVVATGTPASACACDTDARDRIDKADAAFVGTLVAAQPGPDRFEETLTFHVDEEIKGVLDETVEAVTEDYGDACSVDLEVGEQAGVFLFVREGRWETSPCNVLPPEDVRSAAQPLPEPDGEGPIHMLVGGSWGDVGIVALDDEGRTLAYGARGPASFDLEMCPGSRYFVESYRPRPKRVVLAVRETASLDVVREVEMPFGRRENIDPLTVSCRDPRAAEILFAAVHYDSGGHTGYIFRIRGSSIEEIYRGSSYTFTFDRDRVLLGEECRRCWGSRLHVLDLDTMTKRFITKYPGGAFSVSPDGTRLLAPRGGRRLVVIDTSVTPAAKVTRWMGANHYGTAMWLDDETLVYLPNKFDENKTVKVYRADLTLVNKLDGKWISEDNVIDGDTVYGIGSGYGLGSGTLLRAPLPGGPVEETRDFPTDRLHALTLVRDQVFTRD
jgi:hypothetical protein